MEWLFGGMNELGWKMKIYFFDMRSFMLWNKDGLEPRLFLPRSDYRDISIHGMLPRAGLDQDFVFVPDELIRVNHDGFEGDGVYSSIWKYILPSCIK